ncbi:hypothetical protein PF010_g25317 [Phytophthora fragariae]|uniref:RxLR effector protein n=1 Tax=Phytophthora fragariae TaxID=53985 RepID=A0A6A3HJD8_9STRA|nr:hypothetical protein PF011_g26792 [Phytophthora fragariae]KAE9072858.1 hypothetical protein PF010_g25317 [Phytophthora fragariae]KAE9178387.1 hypothetical protein PF004_g25503 [Phytophthora fragariae]
MKLFSVLLSAAALIALSSTVDAQRLLRSEASAQTDSTVTTDFTTLGSGGCSFTPGNVAAGSSFGALDKENSSEGHRPSGSTHGGAGRGFGSGNGMHNVGSGDGFVHGCGSFGGPGGLRGHGGHGGSFSGGSFAGSFGDHGSFGGSGVGGGHVGGSFGGNMPSIGSGDPTEGSSGTHTPAATSSVTASGST